MTAPSDDRSPLKRALVAIDDLQARLAATEGHLRDPIAVIGIGCRLPGGAYDPDSLWELLRNGVDAVGEVPADRWDVDAVFDPDPEAPGKTYTRWGGFLRDPLDRFDPRLFGIAPREAVGMDPQQRLLLEVAWEALENAGQAPDRLAGTDTGVFLGLCSADYHRLSPFSRDLTRVDAYSASGIAHSVASGRISYVLGLCGPAVSVDTACSSSLVAVHLACQSLRTGECRMALAAGVHLMLGPDNTILFSKAKMMSPEGRCKAFGAGADGFVLGEGCGVVVLKRYADAFADGDRVLAVVRASAATQDGASGGLTVPSGAAQEAAIRTALKRAGLAPAEVGYVEAHGTGTSLGDPIELRALAAVFGEDRAPADPLLVGSIKTNVGHLEAGAGVAGLIKAVLAVERGAIPASLHAAPPSPHVDWTQLPLSVVQKLTPWPEGRRRVAGVSSFGFSGTNVHVIVEESPAPAEPPSDGRAERPLHVFSLSAASEGAVAELARGYDAWLRSHPSDPLADVAHTANAGRAQLAHRRSFLFRDRRDLEERLSSIASGADAPGTFRGVLEGGDRPRLVFLFTGQGAQYAGMGRELYETQPTFRHVLDHCAKVLGGELDRPLLSLMFDEGAPLDQTAYTQPALFALEYALAELWRSWGVEPAAALGHSIGEYVAACVAGVFPLDDALRLVAARGRLMQALPAGGVMVAVQADEQRVLEAIAGGTDRVSLAAVNAPSSVVVSGAAEAVGAVCARLEQDGVKTKPLVVSHAFHSPLMEPMRREFERVAAGVSAKAPSLPLVSNVTGEGFRGGDTPDADYWSRHAREAVRFYPSLQWLHRRGYRFFLEIGPSPTLSGLGPQCLSDGACRFLPSLRRGRGDWETLLGSLCELYTAGTRVDWRGFDRGYARRLLPLPTYPFERERYWFKAGPVRSAEQAAAHPLLGRRLRSAALDDVVFEQVLSVGEPSFVGDHVVHGAVVLPGTVYIEMGLAAARALGVPSARVCDLAIREAMVFREEGSRTVQCVLSRDGDAHRLRVFSHEADEEPWRLHAEARLEAAATAAEPEPLVEVRGRCASGALDASVFYARLAERGLPFGERLRGVVDVVRGDGESLATIQAPAGVAREAGRYVFHPALLDACLQTVAAAVPDDGGQSLFMPVAIGEVSVASSPPARLLAHARVRPHATGAALLAEVTVRSEGGVPLARVSGVLLKKADAAALARLAGGDPLDGLTYEVNWHEQPRGGGAPRLDLATLAEALEPRLPALAAEHGFDVFPEVERGIDAAAAAYVVEAFERLGWPWRDDARQPMAGLAQRLGVAPRHVRALDRLLELLEGQGRVRRVGDAWEPCVAGAMSGDGATSTLRERHPAYGAELELVRRCGSRLYEILRGETDPLSLLFPGGGTEAAEELYLRSPGARAYNSLAAEAIAALASATAGRLRVLEIGGGTGGTTSFLLPRLPGDRTEYLFTDISPLFASRAAERFAGYPFLSARPLDIEKDPAGQGLKGRQFDIVVAANVLHATADLRRTFRHVRQLLAPGGVLVLLEVTRPQSYVDVTFGLTEGWWLFSDSDLRRASPLLSRDEWLAFLRRDAGFVAVEAVPGTHAEPVQAVVFARAPLAAPRAVEEGSPSPRLDVVVLSDEGGFGSDLTRRLEADGHRVAVARAGTGFVEEGNRRYFTDPGDAASLKRLLSAVGGASHVVHLWALDDPGLRASGVGELRDYESRACGSALAVARALVETGSGSPARLTLVTRGTQPAAGAVTSPAGATLWGLGKVIALEHPELRCTRIDLAPAGQAAEIEALVEELFAGDGEDQVALRPRGRFVPRLMPRPTEPVAAAPWELTIASRGTLDGLEVRPAPRRDPGIGEVEIEVRAIGLNFRDVMSALDLYPGAPPPFGSECAGRVVSVGLGVTGVAPGDAVIAIGAGTFRSHAVVPSALVVPKPEQLTWEEAASLAIPFVTAWFCLHHVARLSRGERILIHAAAGGVGLAAVQLAAAAGAEVLATAGSPEKRRLASSFGAAHVMDSRSLSFVEDVRQATAGRGVDVVLNSLSGDFVGASFDTSARGGRFVEIGKRDIWDPERARAARPDVAYTIVDWSETAQADPSLVRGMLEAVVREIDQGRLKPLPRTIFPVAEAANAFRYMAQGRHAGKIVVVAEPPPDRAVEVRPDRTYLVTGGLAGIGLLAAQRLVEKGARHLALFGRSEPLKAAREAIAALEKTGATVRTRRVDVSSEAGLREALKELRDAPPLAGVIHSAGVLDDGVVAQLDWPRFARVLAPKVDGGWALHRATRDETLDFFVLYSSIAGLLGSPGQSNHASANSFLDALAHYRRACGRPAVSLNWGAWLETGAAAGEDVASRAAERGLLGLTSDEGLAALERLLDPSSPQVGVMRLDWSRFLERYPAGASRAFFGSVPRKAAREAATTRRAPDLQSRLQSASPGSREALLRSEVRAVAVKVLGLEPSAAFDPRRPLQEMGLDSLMAVELRNALGAATGRALPATLLFDHPSVEALVSYLAAEVLGLRATATAAEVASPSSTRAAVVDAIEDMSDEDVERLLAEKRGGRRP